MKTNPFYKYNKNRNMDPKEKENINEEELMSEATQDEATENEEIQEEDVQDSAAPTEEEKLAQELEEANKVIEEQKDKYLRLSAEFDNYRKRTMKEKAELILNGAEKNHQQHSSYCRRLRTRPEKHGNCHRRSSRERRSGIDL